MGTPEGLHTAYPFFALTKASYITYLLPFLCHRKGLHTSYLFFVIAKAFTHLTFSLSSQRPSHILPFLCHRKGLHTSYLFFVIAKAFTQLTLSLQPQSLIHFTLSLPSQKPHTSHTSYPFFAITKALYTTSILPFVCHHKDLIHHTL